MDKQTMNDLEYVALRLIGGLSHKDIKEILSSGEFECYNDINLAGLRHIRRLKFAISDLTMQHISDALGKEAIVKEAVENYIASIAEKNIYVINKNSKKYPFMWKELNAMPDVFFARGNVDILDCSCATGSAAIVGSRTPTKYASYATRQFATDIGAAGMTIVSGMAIGVDREAHLAALDNGYNTIAVVAGGPDVIYPYQNNDIYEGLCELGLIISEMPPGYKPIKQYFPARNRLISAISDATLVMEAGEHSGTLHTASFAAAQGKDVFVLPNSIYTQNSLGGLYLIKDGAEVLINSDIVINRIRHEVHQRAMRMGNEVPNISKLLVKELQKVSNQSLIKKAEETPEQMSDDEWKELILIRIQEKPRSADNLSNILRIPFGVLSKYLTELELTKKIEMFKDRYILTIVGH